MTAEIALSSIDGVLPMAEVYDKVEFDTGTAATNDSSGQTDRVSTA